MHENILRQKTKHEPKPSSCFLKDLKNPKYEIMVIEDDRGFTNKKPRYIFVVIDLNLSLKYPENFVCILPLNLLYNNVSNFTKLFASQDDAKKVWSSLLNDFKAKTTEPEILEEIDRRLKLSEPFKMPDRKCKGCGMTYTPIGTRNTKYCKPCGIENKKSYMARFIRQRGGIHE